MILTFFMAFGGGILAPFLLGKPPVFFVNDLLVPLVGVRCHGPRRCGAFVEGCSHFM